MGNQQTIRPTHNVLVIGLCNSGKTHLLDYIVFGEHCTKVPTGGRNERLFEYAPNKYATLCEYGAKRHEAWLLQLREHMPDFNFTMAWFVLHGNQHIWEDKTMLMRLFEMPGSKSIRSVFFILTASRPIDFDEKVLQLPQLRRKTGVKFYFVRIDYDDPIRTLKLLRKTILLHSNSG